MPTKIKNVRIPVLSIPSGLRTAKWIPIAVKKPIIAPRHEGTYLFIWRSPFDYDDTTLLDKTLVFRPNGEVVGYAAKDLNLPVDDWWEQDGTTVRIYWNDDYAIAIGTRSGDLMSETASNVTGKSWTWSATLLR